MDAEKIAETINTSDPITGAKMAAYLRQIAVAIEESDKLFTAYLKIAVLSK